MGGDLTSIVDRIRSKGLKINFEEFEGRWNNKYCKNIYEFIKKKLSERLTLFLNVNGGASEYFINSRYLNLIKKKCKNRNRCSNSICTRFQDKKVCPIDIILKDLRKEGQPQRFITLEKNLKDFEATYTRQTNSRKGTDSVGPILMDRIGDIMQNSRIKGIQSVLKECFKIVKDRKPELKKGIEFIGETSLKFCKKCGKLGEFGGSICCGENPKTLRLYYFKNQLDWLLFNVPHMALELFVYHLLLESGFTEEDLKNNIIIKDKNEETVTELDLIVKDKLVLIISKNIGADYEKKQIEFCRENELPYLTVSGKSYEDHTEHNKGNLIYSNKNFQKELLELCHTNTI